MVNFIIKLDIEKSDYTMEDLRTLEYLLEKTIDGWNTELINDILEDGVIDKISEKVRKLWLEGCSLEVILNDK